VQQAQPQACIWRFSTTLVAKAPQMFVENPVGVWRARLRKKSDTARVRIRPSAEISENRQSSGSGELIRRWNRRQFTLRIASAREDTDFAERQGTLYAVGYRTCTDCLFAGVFRTSESSTVFYGKEFLQIDFPYRSSAAWFLPSQNLKVWVRWWGLPHALEWNSSTSSNSPLTQPSCSYFPGRISFGKKFCHCIATEIEFMLPSQIR
jgi:hypothetical protein